MTSASGACLLVPHTAAPVPASLRLEADVQLRPDRAAFAFRLSGDLDRVRFPAPQPPGPADGLWRHTCFEAFIGVEGETDYREFNFSPSGQWAIYAFRRYREREEAASFDVRPALAVRSEAAAILLTAEISTAALPRAPAGGLFEVGLSAVLETVEGALSWWALRHPAGRSDFHDRAGFALRLARGAPATRT